MWWLQLSISIWTLIFTIKNKKITYLKKGMHRIIVTWYFPSLVTTESSTRWTSLEIKKLREDRKKDNI